MRIWSLSPDLLDTKGLVALWRETLLLQAVLLDPTKGYANHSQTIRFKNHSDPVGAVGKYLDQIHLEATNRGYNFDRSKIHRINYTAFIPVTKGQIEYERRHLNTKLVTRDSKRFIETCNVKSLNALFYEVEGDIESWEKLTIA